MLLIIYSNQRWVPFFRQSCCLHQICILRFFFEVQTKDNYCNMYALCGNSHIDVYYRINDLSAWCVISNEAHAFRMSHQKIHDYNTQTIHVHLGCDLVIKSVLWC